MIYSNIKHFKGLNGLRFWAALFVILHHGEAIRKKNEMDNLYEWGIFHNGGSAVMFFFVLSGFLITYLLLKEKKVTHTIHIKTFYLKRLYRIWPLYFLMVFIGTILLPHLFEILNINYDFPYHFGNTWYWFLLFLPVLVTHFYGHHLLEPLWSIGVEEVFYLLWAPLFKLFKRSILPLLISILTLKVILLLIVNHLYPKTTFQLLVQTYNFESIAIGGLGAYWLFNCSKNIHSYWIFKPIFSLIGWGVLCCYILFNKNIDFSIWNTIFKTPIISTIILSLLFIYLIISTSVSEKPFIKLQNKYWDFLGEISYGLYMYHMIIIFGIIHLGKKYLTQMNLIANTTFFYFAVISGTILIAYISKRYFEDFFLNLKRKLVA